MKERKKNEFSYICFFFFFFFFMYFFYFQYYSSTWFLILKNFSRRHLHNHRVVSQSSKFKIQFGFVLSCSFLTPFFVSVFFPFFFVYTLSAAAETLALPRTTNDKIVCPPYTLLLSLFLSHVVYNSTN